LRKALRWLIPVLVLGIGFGLLYRSWSGRADKAAELPAPAEGPGPGAPSTDADQEKLQKQRLEQTLKAMEETRRLNEQSRPAGLPPGANPSADVQRTFKTLEEINRLNRLNREMREK
jgi:hypothetical protein